MVKTLDDVLTGLRTQVGSDLALRPICTRVMLRTGVNLREPRSDQKADGGLVTKVTGVLQEMGYTV